ncbi:MAG: AMP-dependent synthetase and ligase [Deltaproteobacteria bacterium]|nr:AMP-dependent synthetase and ligase [Deltaproteobacteria bacterium]
MDLVRKTVGDVLDEVASKFPEKEALLDLSQKKRFSYKEFLATVNQTAKGFLKLGLKQGDHLALWSPNRWEWTITQFALAKIGVVLVSIDINCKIDQLEYFLRQSDSRALVMAEGMKGSEYIDMICQLCPEIKEATPGTLASRTLPELQNIILLSGRTFEGMFQWKEILDMGRDVPDKVLAERQGSCREGHIVTILYTSGTTGAPKGVMSTHFGIINTTLASANNQRITEKDRICLSVPLSHMFGCVCVTLASVIKGATLVIPSETFDPPRILEAIEKERCTGIYGSPGAFIALMGDPGYRASNVKSLRTGIMGGAQCPMEVMKKVVGEMGVREIVIGYGQTESSSWITMTRPDDDLELRVSTVGKPLPHVEAKIIDPISGNDVPTDGNAVGEICARGFNMKGYYKMPSATANAIDSGGWLHTGDLGSMDGSGYVRTAGRLKEVINKGGEGIFPTEIEEVLFRHPKISNAQVFGVPDKELGEEVAAWMKLEEGAAATEDEIRQYCKERLPTSHLPRYIKFVREFPTTPLGKVQKFKMREMATEEYGLK